MSATSEMNTLISDDIDNLNKYINELWNFIDEDLSNTAVTEVNNRIEEFETNVFAYLDHWWENQYLPAMKDSAKQLASAQIDQSRQLGTLMDAQAAQQTKIEKDKQALEAQKMYQPSTTTCQVDSVGPGQTKAFRMSRAVTKSLGQSSGKRLMNSSGTPAANGKNAEMAALFDEYKTMFCDPARGDQGCSAAGSMPGANTNVSLLLWGDKQTIDMSNPDNQKLVNASLRTLIAPVADDAVKKDVVRTPAGVEAVMERRAKAGRINAVYNAMGQMMAERVGGSGVNSQPIRTAAGSAAANASTNASYRELSEAMTRARYQNPQYIVRLIQSPEQIVREQGAVNAIKLQQLNDLYKRQEEMLFMEAAVYAAKLDERAPPTAADITKKR